MTEPPQDRFRATYREEVHELLAELETSLLRLDEHPEDPELVAQVFRALHTIKGSGQMLGFDEIARIIHEAEEVFDRIRARRLDVTHEIIDMVLAVCDHVKALLDETETDVTRTEEIRAALRALVEAASAAAGVGEEPPPAPAPTAHPTRQRFGISFRPGRHILTSGTNPLRLLAELRHLGACRIHCHADDIPPLDTIDPEGCYVRWEIDLDTEAGIDAVKDVFIFVEDDSEIAIRPIAVAASRDELPAPRPAAAGPTPSRPESQAGHTGPDHGAARAGSAAEQRTARDAASHATVRVPAARLDKLVNLAGELVTVRARLCQLSAEREDTALAGVAEEVDRYVSELRENVMSLRMVPVGSLFEQLKRVARDLARDLGKEIEFDCDGGETELDKSVIESLRDPLVHLLRNCVDHGIEEPQKRTTAGKARRGVVRLGAGRAAGHVVIQVSDDGVGLDTEGIQRAAVERGLLAPNAAVSREDLHAMVFVPGFSTAAAVTDVSGRGVGLDAVKKRIEHLRGAVTITSERGAGTTISLKIPLTLAIIEGLLVRLADQRYVMPLTAVDECVDLLGTDEAASRPYVTVRGDLVPLVRLRRAFGIDGEAPQRMTVVLGHVSGTRVGLVVDQVLGNQQVMIKSLGGFLKGTPGVAGATVLGDGSVALILELDEILGWADTGEADAPAGNDRVWH